MRALCLFLTGVAVTLVLGCTTLPKVQTYYVSEGVVQYYVLSTTLGGESVRVEMDFTYRNAGPEVDVVTCNFSVAHAQRSLRSVTGASFRLADGTRISLTGLKVLFVERAKRSIRVSSKVAYDDFAMLLRTGVAQFEVVADGSIYTVRPSRRFLAALDDARIEMLD